MTQSNDNVYLSVSFSNTPRATAEAVVKAIEEIVGDNDFSVDYGDPIGDASPTPVADEAANAVGGDPTVSDTQDLQPGVGDTLPPVQEPQQTTQTSDSTSVVTGEENSPVADEGTDLPVTNTPVTPSDTPQDAQPVDYQPGVQPAGAGTTTPDLGVPDSGSVLPPAGPDGTTEPTRDNV